jgi:hypothetical protein
MSAQEDDGPVETRVAMETGCVNSSRSGEALSFCALVFVTARSIGKPKNASNGRYQATIAVFYSELADDQAIQGELGCARGRA